MHKPLTHCQILMVLPSQAGAADMTRDLAADMRALGCAVTLTGPDAARVAETARAVGAPDWCAASPGRAADLALRMARRGGPDVLVQCVTPAGDWQAAFHAAVRLARSLAPVMCARGPGLVLFVTPAGGPLSDALTAFAAEAPRLAAGLRFAVAHSAEAATAMVLSHARAHGPFAPSAAPALPAALPALPHRRRFRAAPPAPRSVATHQVLPGLVS